jgi:hypothetical protein
VIVDCGPVGGSISGGTYKNFTRWEGASLDLFDFDSGSLLASTTSGVDPFPGYYLFNNLNAGNYRIDAHYIEGSTDYCGEATVSLVSGEDAIQDIVLLDCGPATTPTPTPAMTNIWGACVASGGSSSTPDCPPTTGESEWLSTCSTLGDVGACYDPACNQGAAPLCPGTAVPGEYPIWDCRCVLESTSLPQGVVLNSRSGMTCNELCQAAGYNNCVTVFEDGRWKGRVGTDLPPVDERAWFFIPALGDCTNLITINCDARMADDLLEGQCGSGDHVYTTPWTFCQCE